MTKALDFKNIDDEVEFWESNDSAEYWHDMKEVEFDVDLHQNLLHPRLVFLTNQPENCPRCQQGLEYTMIQYVTCYNGYLMIILDVPILRCQFNGHEYMLEKTLDLAVFRVASLILPLSQPKKLNRDATQKYGRSCNCMNISL